MDISRNSCYCSSHNRNWEQFRVKKNMFHGYYNSQAFVTSGVVAEKCMVSVYLQHSNGWYEAFLPVSHPIIEMLFGFYSSKLIAKQHSYNKGILAGTFERKVDVVNGRRNAPAFDGTVYGARDTARRKAIEERNMGVENDRVWGI